jgi:3D (Asp-Asp-Asp) domain-containing protein
MKPISKCLNFTLTKALPLFFTSVILTAGVFIVEFSSQKTEAGLATEDPSFSPDQVEMAVLENNTLAPVAISFDPGPKVVEKIPVVVTAYSSSTWETDSNPYITAAGTWVRDGIVANNLLPFGTKVRIPEIYGEKVFVVEDRMNWKKGDYHIDVWFSSYWEAKSFGAKRTYIEILES